MATNVLSVGIDVPDVAFTVDYPCASSLSTLLQHSGRPARGAGLHGKAFIYIKKTDIEDATRLTESRQYRDDPLSVPDLLHEPSSASTASSELAIDVAATDVDLNSLLGQNVPAGPSRSLTANSIEQPPAGSVRKLVAKKATKVPLETNKVSATKKPAHCVSLRRVVAAHVRRACLIRQINIIYQNTCTSTNCGQCSSCKPCIAPPPRPLASDI